MVDGVSIDCLRSSVDVVVRPCNRRWRLKYVFRTNLGARWASGEDITTTLVRGALAVEIVLFVNIRTLTVKGYSTASTCCTRLKH